MAGEYAKLLNRKVNGGEKFKDGALDKVKAELDALKNGNPDIAKNANSIIKIVDGLNGKTSNGNNNNELLKKLQEITAAVKTDMEKKDKVANLTEDEIEASNYKGSLAKEKTQLR